MPSKTTEACCEKCNVDLKCALDCLTGSFNTDAQSSQFLASATFLEQRISHNPKLGSVFGNCTRT